MFLEYRAYGCVAVIMIVLIFINNERVDDGSPGNRA
jgi:hypothetical protein